MMTVMDLARIDTRLSRVCSNEYAGPCPGCKGTDRFHVKLTKRDGQGGFMCRYCWPAEEKGWGDNIDYLRHFKQLSYAAAREELGLQEKTYSLPPTHMTGVHTPGKIWQETGRALCHASQQCLWSPRGAAGLAYLRGRGFTDATIREAMLGYCPGLSMAGEQWGIQSKQLVIPKGIVIPWYCGGQLTATSKFWGVRNVSITLTILLIRVKWSYSTKEYLMPSPASRSPRNSLMWPPMTCRNADPPAGSPASAWPAGYSWPMTQTRQGIGNRTSGRARSPMQPGGGHGLRMPTRCWCRGWIS